MTLQPFISLLQKLLNMRIPFGFRVDCPGDGTFKFSEIKGEEMINKLLTDKKG